MEKRTKDGYEKKKQYNINYSKENYKRIPLDVTFNFYNQIKECSLACGMSVNAYIKQAIQEKIDKK